MTNNQIFNLLIDKLIENKQKFLNKEISLIEFTHYIESINKKYSDPFERADITNDEMLRISTRLTHILLELRKIEYDKISEEGTNFRDNVNWLENYSDEMKDWSIKGRYKK